jgi:hypothetical protein
LVRAYRKNVERHKVTKKNHAMEANIRQMKRKTKKEIGKQCHAEYTNYEDPE